MVEAVQTSTSTFGIWAIVVVAVVVLAVWLVGISVADNIQTRESRRWRQLRDSEPEAALVSPEPAKDRAGSSTVPGQRRGDEGAERAAASQAAARGRHAKPALDGAGDFRRDAAEAEWRTEAPTRPDLPAQAAPTGRHAMPAQRTGDTDRAERSLAGPDRASTDPASTVPASTDDDSGQR
jgi:hypothetical protein